MIRRKYLMPFLLACLTFLTACQEDISSAMDTIVAKHEIPSGPGGAVAVIQGDSIVFERSFGFRDVSTGEPITQTTNFRLASVTKQFTAASILLLRDQGRIRLDQPLTDFFPDFSPVGRSITIRHLLSHTSGLVAYEDVMADTTTVPVLDGDVLKLVRGIDSTYFPPGTRYRYSNTGYALLALIVERSSGKRFADLLAEEIFVPLGMNGTVAFEKGISEVTERAYGHRKPDSVASRYEVADQSTTSSVLGDGGIYSSMRDLTRWHRSLENPTILNPESLEEAFTIQSDSKEALSGYGFGWMIERMGADKVVYHTGSTRGFRNAFFRVPEKRVAVIVLMNRDDGPAEAIARELLPIALRPQQD